MTKSEFIINVIKLIKPEFYNKITWTIVISGLALIGTPFWEAIVSAILKKEFNLDIAPGGNAAWGYALVVLGLTYHFITNTLTKYIDYKQSQIKESNAANHDSAIFRTAQEIWPEKKQQYFFEELLTDHSYWTKSTNNPYEYIEYHMMPENQYINSDIQEAANEMVKMLGELLNWISLNFWVFPEKQTSGERGLRLCMHPYWNVDRGSHGEPEHFQKYDEVTDKLTTLVHKYRAAYETYRKLVKNKLFI